MCSELRPKILNTLGMVNVAVGIKSMLKRIVIVFKERVKKNCHCIKKLEVLNLLHLLGCLKITISQYNLYIVRKQTKSKIFFVKCIFYNEFDQVLRLHFRYIQTPHSGNETTYVILSPSGIKVRMINYMSIGIITLIRM